MRRCFRFYPYFYLWMKYYMVDKFQKHSDSNVHTYMSPPPSLCGEGVDVFWTLITRIMALLNFFKYDTYISYWKIWFYLEIIVWVTLMYSNQSLQALALGLDAVVAIGVELNSLLFLKVVCLLQLLVCRLCLTFQEHSFTNPFSGLSSQV